MTISTATLGSGGIKLVQRGVTSVASGATVNMALSSVNMSKSFVLMSIRNSVSLSDATMCTADLTSATNLALVSGTSQTSIVVWQVVEFL